MKLLTLLSIFCLAQVSDALQENITLVAGSELWLAPYNNVSYSITHQEVDRVYVEGKSDLIYAPLEFMPHGCGLYGNLIATDSLATDSLATTEVWGYLMARGDYEFIRSPIGMVTAIHSYDYCYQNDPTYGTCLTNVVQPYGTQKNYVMYYNHTQPIHDISSQISAVNLTKMAPICSFSSNSTLPSWDSSGWSFQLNHATCSLLAIAPRYTSSVNLSVNAYGAMTHLLTNMTFSTTGVVKNGGGGGALLLISLFAFGMNRLSTTK